MSRTVSFFLVNMVYMVYMVSISSLTEVIEVDAITFVSRVCDSGSKSPHNTEVGERHAGLSDRRKESLPDINLDNRTRKQIDDDTRDRTIRSTGQTEAGSAGAQPARDSRLGLQQQIESGINRSQNRWIPVRLRCAGEVPTMPQKIHP